MTEQELLNVINRYPGLQRQYLCVLAVGAVSKFDDNVVERERQFLERLCESWNVSFNAIRPLLEYPAEDILAAVVLVARANLGRDDKEKILTMCILAAKYDERLVYAEQILLVALAEALGFNYLGFRILYRKTLDQDFPEIEDFSDPETYEHREAGKSRQRKSTTYTSAEDADLKLLGLKRGCTLDEIKSAYRREAMLKHPDRFPDDHPAARQARHEEFIELKEAYERLLEEYG